MTTPAKVGRFAIVLLFFVGASACDSGGVPERTSTTESSVGQWRREQTSWGLQANEGQRLSIVAARLGDSDCEQFDGVDVIESDEQVQIQAYVRVRVADADEELICAASVVLETSIIELNSPLGERVLTGCVTSRPLDSALTRNGCADIELQR